jgi:hypothetical protein
VTHLNHHGLHYEYLCGFNRPGRDVQGLPMRLVGRLHERAIRPRIAAKQSRRLAPECRDGAGLDLGLGTDPEGRPAIIETSAVGKVGVPRDRGGTISI